MHSENSEKSWYPILSDSISKSLSNDVYTQLGISFIVISIMLFLLTFVYYRLYYRIWFPNITTLSTIYYVFLAVLFITGVTLVSSESAIGNRDDLVNARNIQGVVFSIVFIILFFALSFSLFVVRSEHVIYNFGLVAFIVLGVIVCTWGIAQSISNFNLSEKAMVSSGIVFFLYGIYASSLLLYTRKNNYLLYDRYKKIAIPLSILLTIGGFVLFVVGMANGYYVPTNQIGDYVPVSTNPINPPDLYCTNITRTLSKYNKWSQMVKIRFELVLGENPAAPVSAPVSAPNDTILLEIKGGATPILTYRYKNQKIYLDYYDIYGTIKHTISEDIPINSTTFTVVTNIMSYKDSTSKELGVVNLYNETNNNSDSILDNNLYSPKQWGDTTIVVTNKSMVRGIQICDKVGDTDFLALPLGYQIMFIIAISVFVIFLVLAFLPSNIKQSLFGTNWPYISLGSKFRNTMFT